MRLLILAYDFPPLISVGGLRPASWYKYFAGFGIEVTVVTWDWEYELAKGKRKTVTNPVPSMVKEQSGNKTLVRVRFASGIKDTISRRLHADNHRRVRQAITYIFSFLEHISLKADPQAPLYYEAEKLLQNEKFDFIIATGKPFILFKYAALLSKKYHTPWVADYRDSWTLNHIQSDYKLGILAFFLNSFYKIMERRYVSTARIVTTVAPSYIEFLPAYVSPDKYKIIYNGYDDETEEMVKDLPMPGEKFIISYAGIIYPMQNLELFLDAVAIFIRENNITENDFEMNFWGIDNNASNRLLNYNEELKKYIRVHDKVAYSEVMKKLSYSHLLLILTTAADGWLNAKLFDYLMLKRPVLLMGSKTNIMTRILLETNAGVTAENPGAAASYMTQLYENYHAAVPNNTVNYRQFSRKHQVERFYNILKGL